MKIITPEDARSMSLPDGALQMVQSDEKIHDKEFETKPVSYLQDAMKRFRKNKSSVVAAWILFGVFLFAILVPIFSPFEVQDREPVYQKLLPKVPLFRKLGWDFWDGGENATLNQTLYDYYTGIGEEIGKGQGNDPEAVKPIMKYIGESESVSFKGKKKVINKNYDVRIDHYRRIGIQNKNLTIAEFNKLVKWQNATGIQVLYPVVDAKKLGPSAAGDDPNVYYKTSRKGEAERDKDGNIKPVYKKMDADRYTSLRIEGDPGIWAYFQKTQTGVAVRADYYNYFRYIYSGSKISSDLENTAEDEYKVGAEPVFFFGTNQHGQDIFTCLAYGARFSFILAIIISTVNIIIGSIIGAMEGYYGGWTDMLVERLKDILAGVPFIVTVFLFREHIQKHVGAIGTVFFAFILTGWIGTSDLVRTQFYRFKKQEYVLAAKTLGATDNRVILKHIFPNAIGTMITSMVLVIPGFIFSESNLSYLGIINLSTANTTSVGTLLAGGNAYLQQFPHIIFFPSLFISFLLIAFNLFGNGLRDAFNPSLRGADE